jgi:AcrR family transcriptional regulator
MARTRSPDYDNIQAMILDRSAALFASRGYAATSIGDIASACECSKSRLYHYFESKEAILSSMLTEHIDKLLDECERSTAQGGDPSDRFHRLIRYFLEVYAVSSNKHVVLLTCLDFLPPDIHTEVVAKQRKLIAYLSDILAAIRPDLQSGKRLAHVDTMLFFGMINWTYTWYKVGGPISADALAQRAVDLFLYGYANVGAKSPAVA